MVVPPLAAPQSHLSREIALGAAEVGEAGGLHVDLVQRSESVDQGPRHDVRLLGCERARVLGICDHPAVDEVHEQERDADDVEVLAEPVDGGNGVSRPAEPRQDRVLARHVVGLGHDVTERRAPQRVSPSGGVHQLVGQVRSTTWE